MKLVLIMCLQEDIDLVADLLGSQGIVAWSRLDAEGWTPGLPSPWSGGTTPYNSQFVVTLVPDDRADPLMRAVAACTGCADDRHPIHAVELDVARIATSHTDARTSGQDDLS